MFDLFCFVVFLNGNCKKKLEACKKKTEESYSDESAGDDDIEVFFSRTHVFFLITSQVLLCVAEHRKPT